MVIHRQNWSPLSREWTELLLLLLRGDERREVQSMSLLKTLLLTKKSEDFSFVRECRRAELSLLAAPKPIHEELLPHDVVQCDLLAEECVEVVRGLLEAKVRPRQGVQLELPQRRIVVAEQIRTDTGLVR